MRRKVMLKEVISAVKLSVLPICCWPLPQDATKFKMFCMTLHHCLSIIVTTALKLPLIYGITNHLDDPPVLVNQIVLLSGTFHANFNFIFHITYYHHIQIATSEIVNFCNVMKPHEEVVIQRYIDKCIAFYGIFLVAFYWITFVVIAILPPLMHQPFPTLAEYPFDVSYQPVKTIIYIQQSMAGIMISGQLCINVHMAMLLWFTSARFEILTKELEKTANVYQLFECIKKHQKLLIYAKEVTNAARPFAFTTIYCSTISLIGVFLLLISHQPIAVIFQFFVLGIISIAEVFMYTWPAEHLMYTSNDIGYAGYESSWYSKDISLQKNLLYTVTRCQHPVTLTVPCLLPSLSLNYYASVSHILN
ncbi:hypothetical protein ALC56_07053 [Trachymyrmex septentrionalis]|uniref:Odorant receptor n=1 Tax=Trachymyrmex septentrionalis TaxID=34720 RepID=A0A195FD36_9HYME|nr:hypothetical protein ALC56_07053 [Trachymyrmex septentrionalis]